MRPLVALALLAAPALAQQPAPPAPACPATPAPLPPELAGWSAPRDKQAAAASLIAAESATLAPGRRADVALLPLAKTTYPVPPERPPAEGTYGGLLSFTVADPGTYRVALGAGAWIDVVRDMKPLASAAHGHGPACTDLRKMVDFALTPGHYLLQVSGNPGPQLAVMVARVR